MTSLIDVIFLLLLFFMLTSTFSKVSEVELTSGGTTAPSAEPPLFLRLSEDGLSLNGTALTLDILVQALPKDRPRSVLVSMTPEVTAQRWQYRPCA
jgi:biopolymer transport protein ExbD